MMINLQGFDLKIDKWWIYKIAGGIFTWLLILLYQHAPFTWTLILGFSKILWLYFLLAITGHIWNDYFDIEYDAIAHKRNVFGTTKKLWYLLPLIMLPFLALGWVVLIDGLGVLFFLVVIQLIISILYAMPPFRLKERSWLAVISTGFYERIIPYLMLFYWMKIWSDIPYYFIAYLAWAYTWECRNYLNGQLDDFVLDKHSNVNSLAIQLGSQRTNALISFVFQIEIVLLFVFTSAAFFSCRNFDVFLVLLITFSAVNYFWPLTQKNKSMIGWVDEVYNKVFLVAASVAILFIDIKYIGVLILLHVAFLQLYSPYYHFLYYALWHRFFLAFLYPKFRGVLSASVNYPIYYFRRYVLNWSDERSRGINKKK